jgi:hypothetical protein
MVPLVASTWPELSNCTGPTRLEFTVEGDGPKYDRFTAAPTDGGAGSRLQPGPGPIGLGPGPCAALGSPVLALAMSSGATFAIGICDVRRGVRSRGESCPNRGSVRATATVAAEASAAREMARKSE